LPLGANSSKEKNANVMFPCQQSSQPPGRLFSPEEANNFSCNSYNISSQAYSDTCQASTGAIWGLWRAVILHFRIKFRGLTTVTMVEGSTETHNKK